MYFSNVILAAGALVPLVSAHGGDGIPHIVGLNVKDLKGRDMLSNLKSRIAVAKQQAHGDIQGMERRQDDKRCGAQYGSCAAGECCSGSGCMASIPISLIEMLIEGRVRYHGRLLLLTRMRLEIWPWMQREQDA